MQPARSRAGDSKAWAAPRSASGPGWRSHCWLHKCAELLHVQGSGARAGLLQRLAGTVRDLFHLPAGRGCGRAGVGLNFDLRFPGLRRAQQLIRSRCLAVLVHRGGGSGPLTPGRNHPQAPALPRGGVLCVCRESSRCFKAAAPRVAAPDAERLRCPQLLGCAGAGAGAGAGTGGCGGWQLLEPAQAVVLATTGMCARGA